MAFQFDKDGREATISRVGNEGAPVGISGGGFNLTGINKNGRPADGIDFPVGTMKVTLEGKNSVRIRLGLTEKVTKDGVSAGGPMDVKYPLATMKAHLEKAGAKAAEVTTAGVDLVLPDQGSLTVSGITMDKVVAAISPMLPKNVSEKFITGATAAMAQQAKVEATRPAPITAQRVTGSIKPIPRQPGSPGSGNTR